MTPCTALHKATPPPSDPKRMRQEPQTGACPVRHERTPDLRGETNDESEDFELLLTPLDTLGQTVVANFSGEEFSSSHSQDQGQPGAASLPSPQTSALWEAVLANLEEQDEGPIEAQLELPNLGQVGVRMVQRDDALEIILRFAQDNAWQHCIAHQSTSAAWLSQKQGRPVHLTLLRETY